MLNKDLVKVLTTFIFSFRPRELSVRNFTLAHLHIRRVTDDNVELVNAKHPLRIEEGGRGSWIVGVPLSKEIHAREPHIAKMVLNYRTDFTVFGAKFHLLRTGVDLDILGANIFKILTEALHIRGNKILFPLVETYERVGNNKMSLEVGELVKTCVRFDGVRDLVAEEGDKEAELGDLNGDGLDVHAIDALFDEVELTLIGVFFAQIREKAHHAVEQAHREGTGTAGWIDGLEVSKTFANLSLRSGRQVSNGLGVLAKEDIEGLRIGHGGQGGAEGLVNHVVDNFTRRVERTGGLTGGDTGLRVVGGEEVFEDLTEELGVEGNVSIGGVVFVDGEVVTLQQREKTALSIEEKNVRKEGTLIGAAGEAVTVDLAVAVVLVLPIQALEETAVKIGNGGESP